MEPLAFTSSRKFAALARDPRLQFRLRNVGAIHGFISARITDEHIYAHRRARKHLGKTIGHITQSDGDDLHIVHTGEIYCHRITRERRSGGVADTGGYAGAAADHTVRKGKDERVIAAGAATLDPKWWTRRSAG